MRRKFVQILGICLLIAGNILAQSGKKVTHQNLIGYRFYNHLTFAKSWEWGLEFEERRFMFPDAQHQYLLRTQMNRKLPKGWSAAAGFAWFVHTLPQDPEATDTYNRPELRPYQMLLFKHSLTDKIALSHRYGLEERFFRRVNDEGKLIHGYDFVYRFRYKLEGEIVLIKKETRKGALGLKLFDEIFLNFGKQVVKNPFDQNRFGGSLLYGLTKNIEIEGYYSNWFQQRTSGDEYFRRHVVRFTLHHYMSL